MEPKCTGLTDGPTTSSHAPDLKDPHMINDAKPDQFVFFFFSKVYLYKFPNVPENCSYAECVRFYYNREL